MGFLLLIPIMLVAAPALLPRRAMLFVLGINILLLGLVLLDMRTTPSSEDDRSFGLAGLLVAAWIAASFVSYGLRFLRGGRDDVPEEPHEGALQALLSWPLPVGLLLSVFAMHWLSNRLAGSSPAWLIHLAVGTVAILAGVVALRVQSSDSLKPLRHVVAVACLGLGALVLKAAATAPIWAARAHAEARSRPYCLLTFSSRDRLRPAVSILELSPLVSRSGGRSFIDDQVAWLVVQENGVGKAMSWVDSVGGRRRSYFRSEPRTFNPPCRPGVKGQLGS